MRIGRDHELVEGRHGLFLANRNDLYVGRALLTYGEYGEHEVRLLQRLMRPGQCLVEAGANVGSVTVPLARHLGPTGRVVALEPQPEIFRNLCTNLFLNELRNTQALPFGCGERAETMWVPPIDMSREGNFGGVSLQRGASRGTPVEVRPLDDLTLERPVDLLKIDVEGMEEAVLRGSERILERDRPVLYLENDRLEKSASLIEWLLQHEYRLWWHLPPLFHEHNHAGVTENLYPNLVSINMLGIHRSRPSDIRGLRAVGGPGEHPIRRNLAPAKRRRRVTWTKS